MKFMNPQWARSLRMLAHFDAMRLFTIICTFDGAELTNTAAAGLLVESNGQ